MARPKKDGKRARGIQSKQGYLYILLTRNVIKDGEKTNEKKWISTGLADTPENIKIAQKERIHLLEKNASSCVDRNTSVADFAKYFLQKKQREISDTTYANYSYKAKCISNYFRSMKIRDVDKVNVERFLDSLFIDRHSMPRTVKDVKVFFGAMMELALKEGLIAYNPVKEVLINKKLAAQYAPEKKADDEFFSYQEAQLFLHKVEDHELYELFYVTLFFGLRREEVLGLKWSSIDLSSKTLRVTHTVTKGTMINRLNTTKTAASVREYPLTDEQVEMFQQLKKKERTHRKLLGREYLENDYIFKHEDGSLYYPDYPTKAFGKLVKRFPELPQNITFHCLRSSCVSMLVHEGVDVKSIQKWVGHADLDTTLRIYAKVKDKEAKQEILSSMDNMIHVKKYTDNE